ncbi:MAG: hypothetical protein COA82_09845 [Alkaliphilus sp.]|nr:MAG: hypothetical protein COA82_09845 [Alkaliphilus sp.]
MCVAQSTQYEKEHIKRSGSKGYKGVLVTFVFCVLYAISDETHQIFVPGRSAQISDVLIDSVGAIVGILMYLVLARIKLKRYPLS